MKSTSERQKISESSEIDLDEKAEQHQQDLIKIDTRVEIKQQEAVVENEPIRKPIKSGSPGQRELKTLFVLSSSVGGLKPNVKKLNDCAKLFEVLYEKHAELCDSKNWDGMKFIFVHDDFERSFYFF